MSFQLLKSRSKLFNQSITRSIKYSTINTCLIHNNNVLNNNISRNFSRLYINPKSHITFPNYPIPAQSKAKSPMEYIAEIPPIEVDGNTAVCDGGDPNMGHPIEYIQLNKVHPDQPETCKYCGLRFISKHAGHH